MGRARALIIAGAIGALAVSAIGAPVAAADTQGTLAIVNGIPGKRVDVCINGNEFRSDLPYGGVFLRNVIGTGNKNLKFYERDPRTCRGNVLAQRNVALAAGDDLTIVATKNAPKVVVFSNTGIGEIPPGGAPFPFSIFFWRHASEVPANFRYRIWNPTPEAPVMPAADPIWTKDDQIFSTIGLDVIIQLRATRPEDPDTIAIKKAQMGLSRRYEWILVGSNPGNTRFVFIDRAVSQPSP